MDFFIIIIILLVIIAKQIIKAKKVILRKSGVNMPKAILNFSNTIPFLRA